MIGDLFDSPWKILIVAVVIIVLFGSKKLPGAARSLGQSMRILKREVSDLHHDEEPDSAPKDSAAQFPQADDQAPFRRQVNAIVAIVDDVLDDCERAGRRRLIVVRDRAALGLAGCESA